ncbi:MAG TPA: ATP-dependent DNA helicase RecG [Candidatus Nanoarchaeia archaeon]
MGPNTPIEQVPKVGSIFVKRLKRLKIASVEDLVHHYPFRYENLGTPTKISEIPLGNVASASGEVWQIKNVRTRYGKSLALATINDGSASIEAVWFNQPFLIKTIKQGAKIGLAGKVGLFSHRPTFINPEYEVLGSKATSRRSLHTRGFVSIYPETAGITSKWLRARIKETLPTILPRIGETLPRDSLTRNTLIPRKQAIWQIHFPENKKQIDSARRRLAFDELLITHIAALERKSTWTRNISGIKLAVQQEKVLSLISNLPFRLTNSQNKVLREILNDLTGEKPMNRLLQGDVGSGKTVIAAIVAYVLFLNGYQTSLMTPTEILAVQHFNTLRTILSPLGVKVSIQTSGIKREEPFDVLIGTHALITKSTSFDNLALVVIDEQHRFGVEQRARLRVRGNTPHVLTMTATPIPRSLALTLYGDLDVSSLNELPEGRKRVKTFVVPPVKRSKAYQFIRENTLKGQQAFIVCPFIEPSETLASVKAARQEYERLTKEIFPDLSLGLLHGRLASYEKKKTIDDFRNNRLSILVSTPVVEVGIDIPNASIMMIEAAERFGLASLHQLRGRVGRSAQQSYCFLFPESVSKQVLQRLRALEEHHLGLTLAEIDLKMRGPGQIYGTAQSGIPSFKIANLTDLPLILTARQEAAYISTHHDLKKLPSLKREIKKRSLVPPD